MSLGELGQDLRLALRQARRTPIVSAVALLSLALGIGAIVALFSLVNALILRPLPIPDPDRLVVLGRMDARGDGGRASTSFTHPQFEFLREHQDMFAAVLATGFARFNIGTSGEARMVPGLYVNSGFLDTLGVTPIIGRNFTADDDRRGGGPDGPVAILNHGFWHREFAGDRSIIGRTVTLDGHRFTIVGVTPPEFFGVRVGLTFDVMVPIGAEPIIRGADSSFGRSTSWWLSVFARLRTDLDAATTEARLNQLVPAMRTDTMPESYRGRDRDEYLAERFVMEPAATGISSLRERYRQPLFVLLGIVVLVLAIACGNMANLLLAQSAERRRELAIRLSLGAERRQLVRQLLTESLALSFAGSLAGLIVAFWGSRAMVAMLTTRTNGLALDVAMDGRVFMFAAATGLVTGLLFGVVPALRGTSLAPADALRDHGRGVVAGRSRWSVASALVAVQIAVSFVLVFGSILFVRTLVGLTTQGMGFQSSSILLASVDVRRSGVAAEQRGPLFEQIRAAVAAIPGVEAAAASFVTPLSGSTWFLEADVPGFTGGPDERNTMFNAVTPGFFTTFGTPLLAGRDFTDADAAGRPRAIVVNEAFAAKFFGGRNPVGHTFTLEGYGRNPQNHLVEIVGLVADAKYQSLREPRYPTMYGAFHQQDSISAFNRLAIRTAGDPWASRDAVVRAIAGVNRDIVVDLRAFEEDVTAGLLQERLVASLSTVFGVLALLLATLGLYGVMSHAVIRRRNEIGIRIALGAEPQSVVRLVLWHVALITGVGLIVGAAASVGTGRFINSLLFNLAASDRTMIAVTAVTLAAAAALAGYLPARRAARIDPMIALRED